MSAPALDKKPGGENLADTAGAAGNALAPGKRTLTEQLPGSSTYVVRAGESLTVLAAKLHTTVEALKAANPGKLKAYPSKHGVIECFNAGEQISVPGAATPAAPETAPPDAKAPAKPDAATDKHEAAEPGLLDRLGGAFHHLIDAIAGKRAPAANDGKPADPRADEHEGGGAGMAGGIDGKGSVDGKAADGKAGADGKGSTDDKAEGEAEDAPFADLSDAERGAKASSVTDKELGKVDENEFSATARAAARKRGQWINARDVAKAGRRKSGDDYVKATDDLIAGVKFTEDQTKFIEAARAFAAEPKPLTPAQEARATIDWSKASLELDGKKLHPDLKSRLEHYVRFLAWANLMSGQIHAGSVMRSPAMAHKLSVAWMFNLEKNKVGSASLLDAGNRQKLVANVTARGGSDQDGTEWMSAAIVEELKANKDDDAKLLETITTKAAPAANKIYHQTAVAAEGYEDEAHRHPNIAPGTFISNHLKGEAVDMKIPFVFGNRFDSLIDAVAMYFGLFRAVKESENSPEHWHYERVGAPTGHEMP